MNKELVKAKQKLVAGKQAEIGENLANFFKEQEKAVNQKQAKKV